MAKARTNGNGKRKMMGMMKKKKKAVGKRGMTSRKKGMGR